MRSQLQRLTVALCAIGLSACASAPAKAPGPRPGGAGQLQVTITGFESEKGQVLVALFLDERGWPDDQTLAFGAEVLPIHGTQAVATFVDVPAGPFAVSVFHDEDLDRTLDTGVFGIPSEDYGFSRDAGGTFGPPGFDEARLDLAAGESRQITIKVN